MEGRQSLTVGNQEGWSESTSVCKLYGYDQGMVLTEPFWSRFSSVLV